MGIDGAGLCVKARQIAGLGQELFGAPTGQLTPRRSGGAFLYWYSLDSILRLSYMIITGAPALILPAKIEILVLFISEYMGQVLIPEKVK